MNASSLKRREQNEVTPDAGILPQLNEQFESAAPETILKWAVDTYGKRLAFVTSFQPSGLAMLHMLLQYTSQVDVLTLDTGLLFPETYALIERWEREFAINVIRVRPVHTVEQQNALYGDALWTTDPDACCHMRKTLPLGAVLGQYAAWITGIRRDQSQTRRQSPIIAWDGKYNNAKLAPMAAWTEEMVWTYIHAHGLPYNPLHDRHYMSIGCQPCTRPVAAGEDARAGRWSGQAKTECGIHVALELVQAEYKPA